MIKTTNLEGPLIELKVGGKLTHHDYEQILPELERIIDHEERAEAERWVRA